MIGVSKLYCGAVEAGDVLRYRDRRAQDLPSHLLQFSADKKPVVVWNVTKQCNLKCLHCYAKATAGAAPDELGHAEGLALLRDLKEFGVPVVLFSGGEPLMRPDLPALVAFTVAQGMRAVISTNGTLIDRERARELRDLGLSYVGISLDGTAATHDRFRGEPGAFAAAMAGVRNCQEMGLKVGLRFTVSRLNYQEVPAMFDLVEEYDIPRICFYHLVYAGRGSKLVEEALTHAQTRELVDLICARTRRLFDAGKTRGSADGGQPRRRPLHLPQAAPGRPGPGGGGAGTAEDERREQLGPGHRLRQLGRPGPRRPVLAPRVLRQRPGAPLQPDLDGSVQPPPGPPQRQEALCHRPLRRRATGWTSAAATSGSGPKPSPGTSGPRTPPATSPTPKSAERKFSPAPMRSCRNFAIGVRRCKDRI